MHGSTYSYSVLVICNYASKARGPPIIDLTNMFVEVTVGKQGLPVNIRFCSFFNITYLSNYVIHQLY